jgi:hypothetical protein
MSNHEKENWIFPIIFLGGLFYCSETIVNLTSTYGMYQFDDWYFTVSVIVFIVPIIVINILSWYCYKEEDDDSNFLFLLHVILIGHLKRYFDFFALTVKLCRRFEDSRTRFNRCYADFVLIEGVRSLLQSFPMAILQTSRIITFVSFESLFFEPMISVMNALICFVSIGLTISSYYFAIRLSQPNKNNIGRLGFFVNYIWHESMAASRIISLACLVVSVQPYVITISAIGHVLTTFIFLQHPKIKIQRDFESLSSHFMTHLLIAFTYLFHAVPVHDGPTRYFYACVYSLFGIENLTSVGYLHFQMANYISFVAFLIATCSFIFGLIAMSTYYSFCHPTKHNGRA